MGAAFILEGSANTTAFELYIEQVLTPSLHAGQIVVIDNLRARHLRAGQDSHRGERLSTAFRDLATRPTFLPFCEAFSKLKTALPEQELEPEKPWKKPLLKHYSPSP